MPNPKILTSFNELIDSFERLTVYSKKANEEYEKKYVLNRFKLTFDLVIKNLAFILEEYKVNCKYPSDYLRNAAKFGIDGCRYGTCSERCLELG